MVSQYNGATMAHYEIEIKSLLGEKAAADALKEKMCALDPATTCISTNKQLNHYFEGGDMDKLFTATKDLFDATQQAKFKKIVEEGSDFSVRTRQKDDEVLLVIKAALDGGTSANTVSRLEFEEPVPLSLEALDQLLIGAGFVYQAKWSREREEYAYKGATVCIDRNAGYGHLAEFEKVVDHDDSVEGVRAELEALMAELGVSELSQERLARMFAHYNENWADYYGTDKTFTIE
jgi:adenylate cyclase class IV